MQLIKLWKIYVNYNIQTLFYVYSFFTRYFMNRVLYLLPSSLLSLIFNLFFSVYWLLWIMLDSICLFDLLFQNNYNHNNISKLKYYLVKEN